MFTDDQAARILDLTRRTAQQDEMFMEGPTVRGVLEQVLAAEELSAAGLRTALEQLIAYHLGSYRGHHGCPGGGVLVDQLEDLIVAILTSGAALRTVIDVGLDVWNVIREEQAEAPEFTHRPWRLILRVTRRAADDDELLRSLAVCWYEELMRDPAYLPALLEAGLDVPAAIAIATHPGYRSHEESLALYHRIQNAFTDVDAAAFRRGVARHTGHAR